MILILDAHALMWHMHGDKRLGGDARRAIASEEHQLVISVIALLEVEHEFQRGRFAHPQADVAELFDRTGRCVFTDITRDILAYYPSGLEIHDALYVATARMLESQQPEEQVAIVTADSAVAASYPPVVW